MTVELEHAGWQLQCSIPEFLAAPGCDKTQWRFIHPSEVDRWIARAEESPNLYQVRKVYAIKEST